VARLAHLGVTLTDLQSHTDGPAALPTIAEYLPRVIAAAGPGAQRTYGTYWERMATVWGDRPLDAVAASDVEALKQQTTMTARSRRNSRNGRHAGELLHVLSAVPDPRSPRGLRYPLAGLLAVAVCAVMAGASSVTAIADWLHDLDEAARARLGFGRGVPATTTMWRLLIRLDADLLATILAGWLQARTWPAVSRRPRYRQVIAIDGKTMRAARRADGSQVHLLSALDTSTGIVLAQVTVAAKSNEIVCHGHGGGADVGR
jgi:hypothetical protein